MAKKIRVYELAKEFGMSNAECLDICEQLGVGATSHSSSMEEAQADRVRRKAEREGLIKKDKEKVEKKPKKATSVKSTATKKTTKKPTAKPAAKTTAKTTKTAAKTTTKTAAKKAVAPKTEKTVKKSEEESLLVSTKTVTTKKAAKPTPKAKSKVEPKPEPKPETTASKPLSSPSKPKPSIGSAKVGQTLRPKTPRRTPSKSKLDVVLPSKERIVSVSQRGTKDNKDAKADKKKLPIYQPRRRRAGRRRRRAPIEELQPVGEVEYTSSDAPVPEGVILLERGITAVELASKINRTPGDIIKYFFEQGEAIKPQASLSDEFIELYSLEVGAEIKLIDVGEEEEEGLKDLLEILEIPESELVPRPPIVTIMGHVDHGKTQLLSTIRKFDMVSSEKGGITQHIGAYKITHNDSEIIFIDTPGHEAFTSMRVRGANITDIVVLVVAADDGVMPQTIESINHAKAANTPIVVAINKIDLETKNVDKVLQQLSTEGLMAESYGGDIQVMEVSATQGTGIDELLERIILIAELEELKTTFEGRATGVVLESQLSQGQGAVATLLISRGTLKIGDPIIAGSAWGKVRSLINDQGERIKEANPSMPVQVLGLSHIPKAGTDFVCAPSESVASKVSEKRETLERGASLSRSSAISTVGVNLEDIFSDIQSGKSVTLNLIVKADAFGSLEAIEDRLKALKLENLKIALVHTGIGGINENDIKLALVSNATIIGFNVRPYKKIRDLAQEESIEIRTYEVIYNLIEDMEDALKGLRVIEYEEVVTSEVEVREIFHIKGVGSVAGCYVQSGKVIKGSGVRFLRDGTIIWKGEIKTLKRFTDDVKEVLAGNECGIGLSDFQDLKPDDIIETYENREIPINA